MKCEREREREERDPSSGDSVGLRNFRVLTSKCVAHGACTWVQCSRVREGEQRKADFPEEPLVNGRKCDTDGSAIVNGVAK